MTRVAAVDLGTNTTRLLVADVDGDEVRELARESEITALGEGVDASRRLLPAAIARVHSVLTRYHGEIEELGADRRLAAATSAVRDAGNGAEFLHGVEERFGFETRLLTGDEEAELTRRGAGIRDDRTLLLDIGGGSTELSLGGFRVSLDVGSVRLTERYLPSDPPAPDELATAAGHVAAALPDLAPAAAVGVAGTVWQLLELAGPLTLAAVEAELERLASVPLSERRLIPKLHPDRAPMIVAGAIILAEVLRRYGLPEIAFSVRDLLDGIALEAARE